MLDYERDGYVNCDEPQIEFCDEINNSRARIQRINEELRGVRRVQEWMRWFVV